VCIESFTGPQNVIRIPAILYSLREKGGSWHSEIKKQPEKKGDTLKGGYEKLEIEKSGGEPRSGTLEGAGCRAQGPEN